jgi:PAS domain S-box-containing protein
MAFPVHQDANHMPALLQSIIDTAIDGIIVMDVTGHIVLSNAAANRLFGYTPTEMAGRDITTLMPSPHREKHSDYVSSYLKTGVRKIIGIGREVEGLRRDGSRFPLRLAVSESRLGDMMYFTGIIHDLTAMHAARQEILKLNSELEAQVRERTLELQETVNLLLATNRQLNESIDQHKKTEKALRATRDELHRSLEKEKELNLLKSRFLSMASHEFKTPLSSILSSAGLIARYDQPDQAPDRQRHIERIKASVNHLNTVLSDFLSISRLEEGHFEPAISEFVLRDMFDALNSELHGLLKPGQELHCDLPDSDRRVRTDPHILRNILYNLLSNAIKYSEPGKPITCELSWPEGALRISVRDEGIGIPVEDQKHIGSRFFRASNVVNTPGTGLGLNIVATYLQTLNGQFTLASMPGEGTTVTITLPLHHEAKDPHH